VCQWRSESIPPQRQKRGATRFLPRRFSWEFGDGWTQKLPDGDSLFPVDTHPIWGAVLEGLRNGLRLVRSLMKPLAIDAEMRQRPFNVIPSKYSCNFLARCVFITPYRRIGPTVEVGVYD
jgi:hypothetical protein